MTALAFRRVHIESVAFVPAETAVTSAEIEDRLSPLYKRLGIPFGTLERLSGISERRMWPTRFPPSDGATAATAAALESADGRVRDAVGALFSCSVSRDLFEPSTGCITHGKLGLGPDVMALDVTNACIGFSNGLLLLSNLIESGVVKAGVVVSSENPGIMIESHFRLLERRRDDITRDELLRLLPTFTLGCGAAAFVLAHESVAVSERKFLGGVAHCASEHADLCSGNGDFCILAEGTDPIMETESGKLISSAAVLGSRTWPEASELLGWSAADVDHVFCHQVGKQVNDAFYKTMGLDFAKDFAVYKRHGNMVSAALPAAVVMGAEEKPLARGDRVVMTAFGSGLNAIFTGVKW